jgi:hypothetical protein
MVLGSGALSVREGQDFAVLYNAGRLLLDGVNPYLLNVPRLAAPVEFDGIMGPYAYPPQFSSVIIASALMPYNVARFVFDVLNVAAIGFVAIGTTLLGGTAERVEHPMSALALVTTLLLALWFHVPQFRINQRLPSRD